MNRFIARWIINIAGLYLAVQLIDGIHLSTGWTSMIWLALIFGFINALLRPLIKFFTFPLIILTLGIFTLVINTFMFWLTSVVGKGFGLGLAISAPVFWNSFLGAIVVSIVSMILSIFLKDKKRRR